MGLLLLALAATAGCSGPNAAERGSGGRGPVPVLVATAVRKSVAERLYAIGRGEAYSTVEVKAQVSGQVMRVNFNEGQEVRKGDPLFTIDPRPYEAALQQAEANLDRDRAQMAQARADFDRYASMIRQGVGSPQQYDEAHAKYESLKATVAADEAAVQTAKLNLAYTDIRSPIDGRTGNLILHAGNLVKANADNAMVVINQVRPIYVDFTLPEKYLAQVRSSMAHHPLAVGVTIPGPGQKPIDGTLSFIDNTVDPATGTIRLKALFQNGDRRLWPGQFVDTTLTLNERPDSVLVPNQAVQTGQDGSYVFLVGPRMKAEMRRVIPGDAVDGQTIIKRGLNGGETVITDGQLRVIPGGKVTIKGGLDEHPPVRGA